MMGYDPPVALTQKIIRCEVHRLMGPGVAVITTPHGERGMMVTLEAEGWGADFRFSYKDLLLSLDDFSNRYLAPVAARAKLTLTG